MQIETKIYKKNTISDLKTLNHQSKTHTFSVSDVDWKKGLDFRLKWMPESLMNVSYLPSYNKLLDKQKLKLNQSWAKGLCEQFIWLEHILCAIAETMLKKKSLSYELKTCLENFCEEETRHTEVFKKLLFQADPSYEKQFSYKFLKNSKRTNYFFHLVTSYPDTFILWTWIAIFFEEKTLHCSREYRKYEKFKGKQNLDPTFSRVHFLHMIDEARHVQIDQHLLSNFYDKAPFWKKRLNARLLYRIISSTTSPHIIAKTSLKAVKKAIAHYHEPLCTLEKEIPSLAHNQKFLSSMHGTSCIGRFRSLLSCYPEMKEISDHLKIPKDKEKLF